MKKIYYLIIAFALVTISFSSCEKDKDGDTNADAAGGDIIKTTSGKSCKLTKILTKNGYELYEYDSSNRLIKISNYYGKYLSYIITITYSSSTITYKIVAGGEVYQTVNYSVVNGIVTNGTSTINTERDGYDLKDVVKMTYSHDGKGYLTKVVENHTITSADPDIKTSYVTTTGIYTYVNDNLTAVDYSSTDDQENYSIKYKYDLGKLNLLPIDESLQYMFTKPSKNLISHVSRIADYGADYFYKYNYTLDAEGLVKKITSIQTDEDDDIEYNSTDTDFEHQCH